MKEVYITKSSTYFPNEPVSNDEMEVYLGLINDTPSKSRRIVLRNNGIENRYYSLDREGNVTHTNAQLVAEAIRGMFKENPAELENIDLLSCGTTSPDQMLPSHAVMVHGLLPETKPIEVTSNAGSCASGMHALKNAFMSVKLGEKNKAVCTGSERISAIMKSEMFQEEAKKLSQLEDNPYLAFEKDFLRWMLSDGAGAMMLEPEKSKTGISCRVDWIELFSYANQMETCMYMGGEKNPDGSLESYMHYSGKEMIDQTLFSLKQDVKLLSANIVEFGFNSLDKLLEKHNITIDQIDHFLPHMSSYFFKQRIYDVLVKNNIEIPEEKWFTNLKTKGNVGSGSIYIMLDELIKSGKLKKGEKILLAVPESARFSYAFCLLTVC